MIGKYLNKINKSKIVGIGIKSITNNTSFIKLENNYSKKDFLKNEKDILKKLKVRY